MTGSARRGALVIATGISQGARPYQEDSLDTLRLTHPDGDGEAGEVVAVLADGMGGHAGGAMASRIAVDHFRDAVSDPIAPASIADRLFEGLKAANESIRSAVAARTGPAGMGCTLVGLHVDPEQARWISVGDSLLWVWSAQAGLRRLNADHSMAPVIDRMAERGVISVAEALADPQRHALRSALTGGDITLIDEGEHAWGGDALLIAASDGMLTLEAQDMAALCAAHASAPQVLAEQLIAAVEAAGDPQQDNTSVVVIGRGGAVAPRSTKTARLADVATPDRTGRARWLALGAVGLALAALVAVLAVLAPPKTWAWLHPAPPPPVAAPTLTHGTVASKPTPGKAGAPKPAPARHTEPSGGD